MIFDLSDNKAKEYLNGDVYNKEFRGLRRNFICLPHPGILMKKTDKNPWPERFENEISQRAKIEIKRIERT